MTSLVPRPPPRKPGYEVLAPRPQLVVRLYVLWKLGLPSIVMAYPPSAASPQAGYRVPSSRVELHISCKNLRDSDLFSKSDPLVAVYTYSKATNSWSEVGRAS